MKTGTLMVKRKRVQLSNYFTFSLFFDHKNERYYCEYLAGLYANTVRIHKYLPDWGIILYVDSALRDCKRTRSLLKKLATDYFQVEWCPMRYPQTPQYFAAERARILSREDVDIAVFRDIDQILSISDIDNIRAFAASTGKQLIYRWTPAGGKPCYALGGGFAIKLNGEPVHSLEDHCQLIDEVMRVKLSRSTPVGGRYGRGVDEFYLTMLFDDSNTSCTILPVEIYSCCSTWYQLPDRKRTLFIDPWCIRCKTFEVGSKTGELVEIGELADAHKR